MEEIAKIACRNNDTDKLTELFQNNYINADKVENILKYAVQFNNYDIIRILLEHMPTTISFDFIRNTENLGAVIFLLSSLDNNRLYDYFIRAIDYKNHIIISAIINNDTLLENINIDRFKKYNEHLLDQGRRKYNEDFIEFSDFHTDVIIDFLMKDKCVVSTRAIFSKIPKLVLYALEYFKPTNAWFMSHIHAITSDYRLRSIEILQIYTDYLKQNNFNFKRRSSLYERIEEYMHSTNYSVNCNLEEAIERYRYFLSVFVAFDVIKMLSDMKTDEGFNLALIGAVAKGILRNNEIVIIPNTILIHLINILSEDNYYTILEILIDNCSFDWIEPEYLYPVVELAFENQNAVLYQKAMNKGFPQYKFTREQLNDLIKSKKIDFVVKNNLIFDSKYMELLLDIAIDNNRDDIIHSLNVQPTYEGLKRLLRQRNRYVADFKLESDEQNCLERMSERYNPNIKDYRPLSLLLHIDKYSTDSSCKNAHNRSFAPLFKFESILILEEEKNRWCFTPLECKNLQETRLNPYTNTILTDEQMFEIEIFMNYIYRGVYDISTTSKDFIINMAKEANPDRFYPFPVEYHPPNGLSIKDRLNNIVYTKQEYEKLKKDLNSPTIPKHLDIFLTNMSNNIVRKQLANNIVEYTLRDNYLQNRIKQYTHINMKTFYHGSPPSNLYSIINNGIVVTSNTSLQTTGAIHGEGIYYTYDVSLAGEYGMKKDGTFTSIIVFQLSKEDSKRVGTHKGYDKHGRNIYLSNRDIVFPYPSAILMVRITENYKDICEYIKTYYHNKFTSDSDIEVLEQDLYDLRKNYSVINHGKDIYILDLGENQQLYMYTDGYPYRTPLFQPVIMRDTFKFYYDHYWYPEKKMITLIPELKQMFAISESLDMRVNPLMRKI